jgi:hypothetical protein
MIGRTSVPNLTRMQLMQNVTRAVVAYDRAQQGGGEDEPRGDGKTEGTTY